MKAQMRYRTPRLRVWGARGRELRNGAVEGSIIQGLHGEAIGAHAPRTPHIDLGTGDPAGHRETLRPGSRPCDGARQGGDLVRKDGLDACGAAQPVPDGIARRPRLALGRLRTAAAAAVSAARFASGFTDHAGSDIVPVLF